MSDEAELDVVLDVCEQPEEAHFPRRPNVISHRGHKVMLNVTITSVPADRRFVAIGAEVFTYGPKRLGEGQHVSRSRKTWGAEPGRTFRIEPENLPATFTLMVSEDGDDHLGQGPYEALVRVNATTDEDGADAADGETFSIEFTSM